MTGVQTCALPICFPVTIRAAYSFYYLLVSEGIKKHPGSKRRHDMMMSLSVPMGVMHRYDVNRNVARQWELFTIFNYNEDLPPVVDLETLYVDEGPITKENQAAAGKFLHDLDARITLRHAKNWKPIIKADPVFLVKSFILDSGKLPEWLRGFSLWVPADYDILSPEMSMLQEHDMSVVILGDESVMKFVGDFGTAAGSGTKMQSRNIILKPYTAKVNNPMNAKLYLGSDKEAKELGAMRNRTLIKIRKEENGRGFISEVNRWINLSDVVKLDETGIKK